tara:strand:+ start:170 stop:358 length:189 start_codon:yes stop_codon:yes gene_type:complete
MENQGKKTEEKTLLSKPTYRVVLRDRWGNTFRSKIDHNLTKAEKATLKLFDLVVIVNEKMGG